MIAEELVELIHAETVEKEPQQENLDTKMVEEA